MRTNKIISITSTELWLIMLEYAPEGLLQEYRPRQQELVIKYANYNQAVRLQNQMLDPHKLLALAAQICSGLDHLQRFKVGTSSSSMCLDHLHRFKVGHRYNSCVWITYRGNCLRWVPVQSLVICYVTNCQRSYNFGKSSTKIAVVITYYFVLTWLTWLMIMVCQIICSTSILAGTKKYVLAWFKLALNLHGVV